MAISCFERVAVLTATGIEQYTARLRLVADLMCFEDCEQSTQIKYGSLSFVGSGYNVGYRSYRRGIHVTAVYFYPKVILKSHNTGSYLFLSA